MPRIPSRSHDSPCQDFLCADLTQASMPSLRFTLWHWKSTGPRGCGSTPPGVPKQFMVQRCGRISHSGRGHRCRTVCLPGSRPEDSSLCLAARSAITSGRAVIMSIPRRTSRRASVDVQARPSNRRLFIGILQVAATGGPAIRKIPTTVVRSGAGSAAARAAIAHDPRSAAGA
jgi:hypothetical protein